MLTSQQNHQGEFHRQALLIEHVQTDEEAFKAHVDPQEKEKRKKRKKMNIYLLKMLPEALKANSLESQNHEGWRRPLPSSSPTINPPPPCPLTMSLSATSTQFLNNSRDGHSTTSLRSLCHLSTVLSKKFFLKSNLNLPQHNFRPSLLILWLLPGSSGQPPPCHNLIPGHCREN